MRHSNCSAKPHDDGDINEDDEDDDGDDDDADDDGDDEEVEDQATPTTKQRRSEHKMRPL